MIETRRGKERTRVLRITNTHGETAESLKKALYSNKVKKAQIKILVITLCMDGKNGSAIAETLHLQPHTVGKYINSFNEGGLEQLLKYKAGSGRPCILSDEEKADCKERLLATPEASGIGVGVNWDSRLLQTYIAKEYGKKVSRSNLQKIMKALGFSYTRPTYVLAKADLSK
jgi:transposase